ncbi:hypothetical protein HZ994_00485 [Akkermansiaceae bacterium]|nr:hypothetical protein HZ994_00485 [Akkermansiaceae bacterium]
MNIQKLLEKAGAFLNAEERKRKEKRKHLKHVIRKLKKHEKKLGEQLDAEVDEQAKDSIGKEITLAHAHRKKALKILKALKKGKNSLPPSIEI